MYFHCKDQTNAVCCNVIRNTVLPLPTSMNILSLPVLREDVRETPGILKVDEGRLLVYTRNKRFFFSEASSPVVGPNQPHFQ